MSIFPVYHYRRYNDPVEQFFGDHLDFFDPWQDYDSSPTTIVVVPKTFRWVNEPQANANQKARHARKFRAQLNVSGYNPETIKTKVENGKVIIEAKQEEKEENGDFNTRQFRKTYPLPEHADAEHLTSYVTPNHILVIEAPIKPPPVEPHKESEHADHQRSLAHFGEHRDSSFDYGNFLRSSDFQPRIVEKENHEKELEMSVEMKSYRPEEIKVSVKNDELIVKGEHRNSDVNHFERTFFFKTVKLPPGTQIEKLQSYLTEDGHLKIQAPFVQKQAELTSNSEEKQTESKDTDNKKSLEPTISENEKKME